MLLSGGGEVLSSVELDRQLAGGAVEVEDVRSHGVLPSELEVRELARSQQGPERSFGVRGISAQLASSGESVVHAEFSAASEKGLPLTRPAARGDLSPLRGAR
jgi:hypothetical protein